MSEISKPFPSASPLSAPLASRDPRRSSRQENTRSASSVPNAPNVPSVQNVPPASTPTRPKSYGEKLIDNLASISTEASTTATLKNEYSRAKKAQLGLNQQYDKLKNLSQFPAARDLLGKIREAQNKDVDTLKGQINSRQEGQKALNARAAQLVDAETQGQNNPPESLRDIENDTKSNKLSVQSLKEDFAWMKTRISDLQRDSRFQVDRLESLKKNQSDDYQMMKSTQNRVDVLSDQIRNQPDDTAADRKRLSRLEDDAHDLKQSLDVMEQYLRQRGDPRKSPADQKVLKTLEDRINGLEKGALQHQNSSPGPNYEALAKTVNNILPRLGAIEGATRQVSSTTEPGYQHLKTVVDEMVEWQTSKDNLLLASIEEDKKQLDQRLEEIVGKIKAEAASNLEKAMLQVKSESVPIKTDGMASLKELEEQHDGRLQTVETAITSLEARYSSFTYDSIAQRIVPLVQGLYPTREALHNAVETLHVIQMHLSQISNIPGILAAVDNHSRQLVALGSNSPRMNGGELSERNSVEMRKALSHFEQKINELQNQTTDSVNDLQLQSRNLNTTVTGLADKAQTMEQGVNDLQSQSRHLNTTVTELSNKAQSAERGVNDWQSRSQNLDTAVAELSEKAQSIERSVNDLRSQYLQSEHDTLSTQGQLSDRVRDIEGGLQMLKNKIEVNLGDDSLQEIVSNHENLEASLQHYMEDLNQQIIQLEDKQKNTGSDVENLNKQITQLEQKQENAAADMKLMSSFKENLDIPKNSNATAFDDMSKKIVHLKSQQDDLQTETQNNMEDIRGIEDRLDDLEQAKTLLMRKYQGTQSPGSASPTMGGHNDQIRQGEDDAQTNTTNITIMGSSKRNKRKLSTVSSSPHSSPIHTPSSTPRIGTPDGGGPSGHLRKRPKSRSLMSLVNKAK